MSKHEKSMLASAAGIAVAGAPRIIRARFNDGTMTFDRATIDSTGAFMIGELERLDQTLHAPLASVTWGRDIDLREDVSITDDLSSFTNSSFAAAGGASPNGKAWIGKDSNAIQSLSLDIGKTANPLFLWGMELGWSIIELKTAIALGRPVDAQKYAGMQLKYQMDVDEQVNIGDAMLGVTGLTNHALVENVSNARHGAWDDPSTTPDDIVADIDELLNSVWAETGFAICPSELRLAPKKFSKLVSRKVSDAGNISVLEYVKQNTVANSLNGRPLNIQPLKWLVGRGAAGKDRMIAYTKDKERVRFPLVPLQNTPIQYRGIDQLSYYFGRLGAVEVVYPETIGYRDGM